jgi:hypothetical protein
MVHEPTEINTGGSDQMYRILSLRNRGSTDKFVVYSSERETLRGLFERAGVSQDIILKVISSEEDSDISPLECFSLAKRIRMTLSLRRVLWVQETPTGPGLAKAGSGTRTRTLDKPLRDRLSSMAAFLEKAARDNGCTVRVRDELLVSNG